MVMKRTELPTGDIIDINLYGASTQENLIFDIQEASIITRFLNREAGEKKYLKRSNPMLKTREGGYHHFAALYDTKREKEVQGLTTLMNGYLTYTGGDALDVALADGHLTEQKRAFELERCVHKSMIGYVNGKFQGETRAPIDAMNNRSFRDEVFGEIFPSKDDFTLYHKALANCDQSVIGYIQEHIAPAFSRGLIEIVRDKTASNKERFIESLIHIMIKRTPTKEESKSFFEAKRKFMLNRADEIYSDY